jgi:SAM-dependent methyltransferase
MSSHSDSDQSPYDEPETLAQVQGVKARLIGGPSRVLDLGCGSGRIARHLSLAGHHVTGVDRASGHRSEFELSTDAMATFVVGDFSSTAGCRSLPAGPFDAILLLGNTLALIREPGIVRDLFLAVAERLDPEGILVYDDFPFTAWSELAAGNWGEGISEDGSMQMIWIPGEPEFVLRSGDEVDPEAEEPRPEERVLRIWSMAELNDAAELAGLTVGGHDPGASMVVHVHASP